MGMILTYCRVSRCNAKLLQEKPALIHRFMSGEAEARSVTGLLGRLFGGKKALPRLEPRVDGDESDTDKSWHAIHYLLTGTSKEGSPPLNFIFDGGTHIGKEDVGYGPARIFAPTEVAAIATALAGFEKDILKARYNGPMMDKADVYPKIWGRESEDNFEYAWENFVALREFIQATRTTGDYFMLYLC